MPETSPRNSTWIGLCLKFFSMIRRTSQVHIYGVQFTQSLMIYDDRTFRTNLMSTLPTELGVKTSLPSLRIILDSRTTHALKQYWTFYLDRSACIRYIFCATVKSLTQLEVLYYSLDRLINRPHNHLDTMHIYRCIITVCCLFLKM
jgi:hypothetical protein